MDMELGSAELKESKPEVVFNNGKMVEIETSKANMKGNKPQFSVDKNGKKIEIE